MVSPEGGNWVRRAWMLLKARAGHVGRSDEEVHPTGMTADVVIQVKVVLLDIDPPIWRRLLMPAHCTLADLHDSIQVAFGWEGWHCHVFEVWGREYGSRDPVEVKGARDERVALAKLGLAPGTSIHYVHDFGDNWAHEILVEKILEPDERIEFPVCLEGRRSGPPDDCGGPSGYKHLLKVWRNRNHPEHRDLKEWLGSDWKPEVFRPDELNSALKERFASATDPSVQATRSVRAPTAMG